MQAKVVAQAAATGTAKKSVPTELEEGELPLNTFSPKKPFKAKIKSVEKITGPKATGETYHIIIDTKGDIPFWEGQSYGVIPPVSDLLKPWHGYVRTQVDTHQTQSLLTQGEKTNSRGKKVPHGTRLYSIAASRYGDQFDGKTTSLCVRRATFWDSEKNAEDPEKKGICSNFLADAKPGDEISMTGQNYPQLQHFPCFYEKVECAAAHTLASIRMTFRQTTCCVAYLYYPALYYVLYTFITPA